MDFLNNHLGEFSALLVAVFWTITSLAFESASHRIGSVAVNVLRLIMGLLFLTAFTWIRRGLAFPLDASAHNWLWLSLSGLIGFVFGDLFLFKSYMLIGSRFSMLIMTLVPPITAFFSLIILTERLTLFHLFGMTLTFAGIALAIFNRNGKGEKFSLKLSPRGILYALGGAVGQALGLVLSKLGMENYDPFPATQIRIIAGLAGYIVLVTLIGRWGSIVKASTDSKGMALTSVGAFFGPFLGVSFSLVAIKFTEAGVASTIMALVPVFILIPAVLTWKEKVTMPEIIGSVISVAGVALFFM